MEFLLELISHYAVAGIVLFGVTIAVLLVMNGLALSNQKEKITEALERRNKKYELNDDLKMMEETDDGNAAITPDTIRKYETEFNKKC